MTTNYPAHGQYRQQVAAEVLELGEALFDAAIEAAVTGPSADADADAASAEELRAAADEFFVAVRLLLGLEHDTP